MKESKAKYTKKTIKRVLYSRGLIFVLLILIQLFILFGTYFLFSKYAVWALEVFKILSIAVIIYIMNNDDNAMYKLAWIIPILVFPFIGTLLYIYVQLKFITSHIEQRHNNILKKITSYMSQDDKVLSLVEDKHLLSTVKYVNNQGYNIYQNTEAKYYELGELFFEDLKKDLKKAKKFIFMEYFIINDNSMWNEILDILKLKQQEGVEIRIMYDGFGSIVTLPLDYCKYLNSIGIQCQVFFPVKPILSTYQNNRDHRKITVIDGEIGYTGGINLSDEYINRIAKHGHWKDTALRLNGEGVKSLTLTFLQLWDIYNKSNTQYENYITDCKIKSEGLVMPFADTPFDRENIGEEVYIDIINYATEYVYITTPYLILDGEMLNALKHAVARGVEVIIVLPYISDGKGTREVASSYYKELINAGVKIYEYTPGFMHAKMFVVDDNVAIVGTINLDYRSLYLHFENAVLLYKNKCIANIKEDIKSCVKVSKQITIASFKDIPFKKRAMGRILRLVAPLM